jgi:hypothetical protein
LVLAAFLAITLPFYLHDPSAFGPRHSLTKLHEVFPQARLLVFASTAALALFLASRRNDSFFLLFRNSALVQALFFLWAVVLFAIDTGDIPYTFVFIKEGYGIQFLFFGALAWWIQYGQLQPDEGAWWVERGPAFFHGSDSSLAAAERTAGPA